MMRDRLIELIKGARKKSAEIFAEETKKWLQIGEIPKHKQTIDEIEADYLLGNGVIVPPVKAGQILYIIEAGVIIEAKVKEYKYCSNSNNGVHWHIIFEELFAMSEAHIGESVFYTREEAEQALKGGV